MSVKEYVIKNIELVNCSLLFGSKSQINLTTLDLHLTIYSNNKILYNDALSKYINDSIHNEEINQSFMIPIKDSNTLIKITSESNYDLNDIICKSVFDFY